ncbi:MAG: hypothetical protein IJ017_01030, partial [Oscillospiraceae bacterium]|nr:hypothetical protein [Oscillospiraceae bacterium]
MKKKLLSLLLVVLIVLGMFPMSALAVDAPFTVTVGGETMTEYTVGEVTDPYNGTVPLYTVTIPAGTTEVNITWNDGNNYTLSYYDANCSYFGFESAMQNSWTVAMDKNSDGEYDMLQVYDSGYGVPYWITFASEAAEEEPEQPATPFTVTVGGETMTEYTVGEVTDPYNGTVPLYTV